jgi:hypothetical protein
MRDYSITVYEFGQLYEDNILLLFPESGRILFLLHLFHVPCCLNNRTGNETVYLIKRSV